MLETVPQMISPKILRLAEAMHKKWADTEKAKGLKERVKIFGEYEQLVDKEKGEWKKKKGWYNESNVKDGSVKAVTEEKRQDILNTDFANLDPFWKKDNLDLAPVYYEAVKKLAISSNLTDLKSGQNVERGAAAIHTAFLKNRREAKAYIPDGQDIDDYNDLIPEEKQRDREMYLTVLSVYEEYTGDYTEK